MAEKNGESTPRIMHGCMGPLVLFPHASIRTEAHNESVYLCHLEPRAFQTSTFATPSLIQPALFAEESTPQTFLRAPNPPTQPIGGLDWDVTPTPPPPQPPPPLKPLSGPQIHPTPSGLDWIGMASPNPPSPSTSTPQVAFQGSQAVKAAEADFALVREAYEAEAKPAVCFSSRGDEGGGGGGAKLGKCWISRRKKCAPKNIRRCIKGEFLEKKKAPQNHFDMATDLARKPGFLTCVFCICSWCVFHARAK